MDALESRVSGGSKQPQGTVRIAATLGFGRTHIAPALSRFIKQHSLIDVQLHLSDRPVNLVNQGLVQATKQTPAKVRVLVDWLLEDFNSHRVQTKNLFGTWG